MKALDTDVLSEIIAGNAEYVSRAAAIPERELCLTVVSVDEALRELLAEVRRAESGRGPRSLSTAYDRLRSAVTALGKLTALPYTREADALFRSWRSAKLMVGSHDLRIAAICVTSGATLVTRNRRHFERVPGLRMEPWA